MIMKMEVPIDHDRIPHGKVYDAARLRSMCCVTKAFSTLELQS